uniref:RING-type E3 ubiquitin transferase n=1 Tax=Cicer arietinum TaxID=3827 RepID=A0A1S3EJI8_CICAR|nr:probable E3 ubiquitin-protein ligase RHC1A isoform X1 [Cicer arietinum]XP_027186499.1 probable E3 ubiquitin-protein ligase RHC1A isoform X1 [Cicer arietinum]
MSSSEETHWCYSCRRPVHVQWGRRSTICSECDGEFVQHLDNLIPTTPAHDFDDSIPTSPGRVYDEFIPNSPPEFQGENSPEFHRGNSSDEDEIPPRYGLTETFSAFMRHQMAESSHNVSGHGRIQFPNSPPFTPPFIPVLIYSGPIPSRFSGASINSADYFDGPGLDELVEQISADDRQGPPPASQSAIAAIPSVKIKKKHIKSDSRCPICQNKFKLGSDARQLPCKHIFHEKCILPWLAQNNTCPTCRHELPPEESSIGSSSSNNRSSGRRRRNNFSFLWPFRNSDS